MGYKTFFLVCTFLLFACHNDKITNDDNQKLIDTISSFYELSKDKSKSPQDRQKAINAAYTLCAHLQNDTLWYKIVYQKAVIHNLRKEYDSLLHYNAMLFEKAVANNNYYYQGKSNYLKAFYFNKVGFNSDSAFYYYNRSKNDFLIVKDSLEVGKKLLNMAYIQKNSSDFFGSKETVTEALDFLTTKNGSKYIASSYNLLASNNRKLLNLKDAIYYYKKALDETNSIVDKLKYQNNLATTYIDQQEYEIAILLLRKIAKDSNIQSPAMKARILDNLAYSEWLKDRSKISDSFFVALDIRKRYNDMPGLIASYTHLGEVFSKKNSDKALDWYDKAIVVAKRIKKPKGELDALRFLMELKPNNLPIKNRYIHLNDSLQKQSLKVKTQFAEVKYEKMKEIEKLTNMMIQQQHEASLQRKQKIIYALLGSILLLFTLFFTNYLRKKYITEKEKEIYKTEQRISKKIHDEVANDLSVLANYVDETPNLLTVDTKAFLENKLQNIYLRARDISVETASINLSGFSEELKNLILQYNTNQVKVITNISEFDWQMISDYKRIAIYRVIQELFINAKKHSSCTKITLIIKDQDKKRIITYRDNGIGVNIETIKKNGLVNAESRIENINGKFNFDTSPGNGFRAQISFHI
ncbi:ATP-binding protein [Aquimarina sp. 2201CG5-10]|uniref:tetratricopeptide repeat-containing sensor histidine kinase n=1 Tax=Aquimarina callyspongiae TaxID=3098150 RepID=UPI002AB37944|nr:ATP-binding protein [Aquimarina sp. 2201CG5-10]MDY8134856.1 hypothetical protein [Aquimarina sp. 2201CG5-10]